MKPCQDQSSMSMREVGVIMPFHVPLEHDVSQNVHELEHELDEANQRERATAEVLRVISSSPANVQAVFDTIVQTAVSLCGSLFANIFRFDSELLHFVAGHNVGPSYMGLLRAKYPMRPDTSQVSGRVLLTKSVVRLQDGLSYPDYHQRISPAIGSPPKLGGANL